MKPKLLECTLRDGSYAVDFQFTSQFTGVLCRELDNLGFDYIEVGHGIGIGAEKKYKAAAATDMEYAIAAEGTSKNSKWGMFAQPHISTFKELKILRELGMKFVRIGVDLSELQIGLDLAQGASELGLEVFINLMKSYRISNDEMADACRLISEKPWIKGFYLVDSAGGMLTSQVDTLSKSIQTNSRRDLELGFHGHDNLGMALAHSLLVMQNGFSLIDCTLQGLGRSSGNTSTERLIALLNREGIANKIDPILAMKISDKYIRPIIPRAGHSGLDTMAGYALFHTAYMDQLLEIARANRVDPYALMQEIGMSSPTEVDIQEIVNKLKNENSLLEEALPADRYVGNEQT